MSELQPSPTVSQFVDGPVSADDRAYASHMLEQVSRDSPCGVRRARVRLFAEHDSVLGGPAIAEAVIMLQSGSVICAGSVAGTMPEAVDDLRERLRGRLRLAAARASRRLHAMSELRPRRWTAAGGAPPGTSYSV